MPLLLYGARQVGKTCILYEFGQKYYEDTVYVKLETNRSVAATVKTHSIEMREYMDINQLLGEEILIFYQTYSFRADRNISLMLVDDLYSSRLKLAISKRESEIIRQNQDILSADNGTIAFGNSFLSPCFVLVSKSVFEFDNYTWRGTIQHEYTHMHDILDLAEALRLHDMDAVYDYEYYEEFLAWSEYHARRRGFARVLGYMQQGKGHREIQIMLTESAKAIVDHLMSNQSLYELMQFFGRYSILLGQTKYSITPINEIICESRFTANVEATLNAFSLLESAKSFSLAKNKMSLLRSAFAAL